MNDQRDIVRELINKVREFKTNSMSKDKLFKDLINNPNKADNNEVLNQVKETAEIVKQLFTLLDEFDMLEGNVSYLNED
jgi:hypothetical protein